MHEDFKLGHYLKVGHPKSICISRPQRLIFAGGVFRCKLCHHRPIDQGSMWGSGHGTVRVRLVSWRHLLKPARSASKPIILRVTAGGCYLSL